MKFKSIKDKTAIIVAIISRKDNLTPTFPPTLLKKKFDIVWVPLTPFESVF